jgi:hypothetical protein
MLLQQDVGRALRRRLRQCFQALRRQQSVLDCRHLDPRHDPAAGRFEVIEDAADGCVAAVAMDFDRPLVALADDHLFGRVASPMAE